MILISLHSVPIKQVNPTYRYQQFMQSILGRKNIFSGHVGNELTAICVIESVKWGLTHHLLHVIDIVLCYIGDSNRIAFNTDEGTA